MAAIPGWQVLHVAGEADRRRVAEAYAERLVAARTIGFTEHMADALAAADLVVSRAGAATLGEFPARGLRLLFLRSAGMTLEYAAPLPPASDPALDEEGEAIRHELRDFAGGPLPLDLPDAVQGGNRLLEFQTQELTVGVEQ